MRAIGIIPARYSSSRFPGKPLADINGRPMIQWVYERSLRSVLLDDIIVATDDERIEEAVLRFDGHVIMTSDNFESGTDRVAAVAETFPVEVVANIQGDEPLIEPQWIDQAVRLLLDTKDAEVSTLAYELLDPSELGNSDTVRVVLDRFGRALYFSRAAIPHFRDFPEREEWLSHHTYYNQIGLYVFRKDFLIDFARMQQTPLEMCEKLEQLRILENGYRIQVGITTGKPLCVDTPQDLERVRDEIGRRGL